MFIVVEHTVRDAAVAFARGQNLLEGRGAPAGVQVRKFYPSTDQSAVICLWEGDSLEEVRDCVELRPSDLPLDELSRLVLARRLVREGLLRVVTP